MIVAHVCHMTGWTWDYVEDTLTVPRLKSLYVEWKKHPPIPILLAAFMGIKPVEKGEPSELVERLQAMQSV